MSRPHSSDPFPAMTSAHETEHLTSGRTGNTTRPRRRSSGLGGDPRGDTSAPGLAALATRDPTLTSSPTFRSSKSDPVRGRKRRKARTLLRRWKVISLRHTWLNPLILVLIIVSLYLVNPSPSNPVHKALFLSYPLPKKDASQPTFYGKGHDDAAFVAFYTIVLSFTREFIMQRMIKPIAIRAGIKSRARQSRFMEQYYTAIYFSIFGPFGLYVMSKTPVWYFNTKGMFEGFPHTTLEGIVKAYYLLQASYWAQQMLVMLLMLEKPRKDFKELLMHHIITLALIWLSYWFHFTHMGLAVYITMDISDFFLASSKVLNYLDSPIVTPYFAFFIGIWTYLRHYINIKILLALLPLPNPIVYTIHDRYPSLYASLSSSSIPFISYFFPTDLVASDLPGITQSSLFPSWQAEFATVGKYKLDWVTEQYKCWISQWIAFGLLAMLQAVNVFWLVFILRIAYRLVASWGEVVKDERSEDEDSEVELDKAEKLATVSEHGDPPAPALLVNGEPMGEAAFQTSKGQATPRRSLRERKTRETLQLPRVKVFLSVRSLSKVVIS